MPEYSQAAVRDCLKSYMQSKGITYQMLADRLKLSVFTVNNYLSTTPIPAGTLHRIAIALDYPEELLRRGERYYGPDAYAALEARIKKLEEAVFSDLKD